MKQKAKTHKLLVAAEKKAGTKKITVLHEKEVKPNQMIPLDEADFQEFYSIKVEPKSSKNSIWVVQDHKQWAIEGEERWKHLLCIHLKIG